MLPVSLTKGGPVLWRFDNFASDVIDLLSIQLLQLID